VTDAGHYITANGIKTYYEENGRGEPLVLMHGGFGTAESMLPMSAELSKHYRVFVPERRGHGHTPDAGPISYDLMAADTIAFMEALGIAKAQLVGYSDGAIVGLFMAMQRPDLVNKLAPISANFHFNGLTEHMRTIFANATPEAFAAVLGDLVTAYNAYSPDGPDHFPVLFAKMKELFLTQPTLTVDDLAAIKAPTLVVAADRDLMTIEHTLALFQAISNAQLCIVPGANHNLVFDKADQVSAAVMRFLS